MFAARSLAGRARSVSYTLRNFFLLFFARLPYKQTGAFFIGLLIFTVLISPNAKNDTLAFAAEKITPSLISESFKVQRKTVPFETHRIPDNTLPVGEEKVIQDGKKGLVEKRVRTLSFKGNEFTHDVIEINETPPTNQLIAFGTKKTYQTFNTPDGQISYWSKLRMFATSYDPHCHGCSEHTAIGLKAGYGVVAVDPKVIPLRSKLYIPGYGFAVAGDTGGKIKGNRIDLGFDDVKNGWWSSRYTDVYILSE